MFAVYEFEVGWKIVPGWRSEPLAKALLFQREGANRAARALARYLELKEAGMRHSQIVETLSIEGL